MIFTVCFKLASMYLTNVGWDIVNWFDPHKSFCNFSIKTVDSELEIFYIKNLLEVAKVFFVKTMLIEEIIKSNPSSLLYFVAEIYQIFVFVMQFATHFQCVELIKNAVY